MHPYQGDRKGVGQLEHDNLTPHVRPGRVCDSAGVLTHQTEGER